jgi:cytidylate kinase
MRAHRRWKEERERGREVSAEEVRTEIEERDARDRERTATPLVKAGDAILIDTSDLDVDALVDRALEIIKKRTLDYTRYRGNGAAAGGRLYSAFSLF